MLGLNDENKQPFVAIVAVLVIVIAGMAIYWNQSTPNRKMSQLKTSEGLGAVLAQEASKAVGDHGQVVLVTHSIDPSHSGDNRATADYAAQLKTELDGFQNELRSHPGVVIAATERVEAGLTPEEEKAKGLSAHSSYLELATKYANADVIVSMIDAPQLDPNDLSRLPKRLPKVVAVSDYTNVATLQELSAAGLLQAAIIRRIAPPPATGEPHTPAEWFARDYQIVTSSNIDTLSNPSGVN